MRSSVGIAILCLSATAAAKAPIVDSFAPTGGPPGTRVTITGSDLGPDLRVAYDGESLPVVARAADREITVVVPRTATRSAAFVLAGRAGATRSGAYFQLALPAALDSLSPTSGPPGTPITIKGRGFHGDESFRFGDAPAHAHAPAPEPEPARVLERQPWGVRLAAPEHGGALSYTSAGQTVATRFTFDVTASITVASLSPTVGPPGTEVILRGPGLDGAVRVLYGGLPCPLVRRAHDELVVAVPKSAAGEDAFTIEGLGQRVRSADTFRVDAGRRP